MEEITDVLSTIQQNRPSKHTKMPIKWSAISRYARQKTYDEQTEEMKNVVWDKIHEAIRDRKTLGFISIVLNEWLVEK